MQRNGSWLGRGTALAVLSASLLLSGCTSGGGGQSPTPGVTGASGTSSASATAEPSPGPTTPVQPTGGEGNVSVTVAPSGPSTPIEEELGSTVEVQGKSTLTITGVQAITAEGRGPGEVGGPAVAVTIEVVNRGTEPLDVSLANVNMEDSAGQANSGMTGPPAQWFTGSVPAGERATGVYVFTVPEANRNPVHIEVSVNPTLPTVVFTGPVN